MGIDEYVLRFEIAMEDPFGVDVCDSVDDLFNDYLDPLLVDFVVLTGDELL